MIIVPGPSGITLQYALVLVALGLALSIVSVLLGVILVPVLAVTLGALAIAWVLWRTWCWARAYPAAAIIIAACCAASALALGVLGVRA